MCNQRRTRTNDIVEGTINNADDDGEHSKMNSSTNMKYNVQERLLFLNKNELAKQENEGDGEYRRLTK